MASLRTFSNTIVRNGWSLDTISLAAYAGQSIRIVFAFSTDSSIATNFYIDDVDVR
jgi:hypothetical protein